MRPEFSKVSNRTRLRVRQEAKARKSGSKIQKQAAGNPHRSAYLLTPGFELPLFRHGVVAKAPPGPATEQPPESQPPTLPDSPCLDRLERICRAGGVMAAGREQQRRYHDLVTAD